MFSTQLKTGLLLAFTFVAIFSFGLNSNEANVRRSSAVEEFTVQTNANGQVTLSWKQNEEFENDLFSIERSTDGEAWFKIAEIHPLENRQITRSYDYVDETPLNGISFYRVKSITTSGDRWNAEPEMVYLENDQQVKIFPV